jgi:hypothetical protein
MNRSIAIAYFLSVVIHIAVFLYPPFSSVIRDESSVNRAPQAVNVILWHQDNGDQSQASYDRGTQDDDLSNTATTVKAKVSLDDDMKLADADDKVRTSVQSDIGIQQEAGAPPSRELVETGLASFKVQIDAPAETYPLLPDNTRFLATTRPSDDLIRPIDYDAALPVPEKVSMSPKQQKMLNKKFRKWAENFYRMKQNEPRIAWEYGGQDYTAMFRHLPAQDNMTVGHVIVEVNTEENGNRLSTEMRMKRLAFSNFAQFVDRWDPGVQMHDDELEGRFHSNSRLYLESSRNVKPQFHGKVTTASRGIDLVSSHGPARRDSIFLGGLETGVKRIVLPKHFAAFLVDSSVGHENIQRFDEDTRITFYPDGTYGWTLVESDAREQIRTIPDRPSYIIGAAKKKLYLKGIVRGKILVYSPGTITIENDLTYADDPDVVADAGDYLGLVSDKDIEIAHPDITGPGDLLINAAIYAKRRFVVKKYSVEENAMLFIYGSLTAGSLSATEPRYRTKIEFDRRLEKIRPPNFPVTNRYEVEAWDGKWEIENSS